MAGKLEVDPSKNGDSKIVLIVTILSVCAFISTTLVALRVYTRAVILKGFGLDDWILIVAQILCLGAIAIIGMEEHYGLGKHIWLILDKPAIFENYLVTFYASLLVYNASLLLVKISITLMYRRIFVTRIMRIVTVTTLVFLVAWGFAMEFSLAFICVPAKRFWDISANPEGFCHDFLKVFLAVAVTNMLTDFIIFLIPLPSIRTLQLPLKQKLALAFILCLGLLTCIVSIIRLQSLPAAAAAVDTTWDNTEAALWSIIELTVAIIAACLPTLGPLMSRFFPRFMNLSSSARNNGGSYGHNSRSGNGGNGTGLRSRTLGDGGLTAAELASRRNHDQKGGAGDSTEELYMHHHHHKGQGNELNDAEIGLSELKFHAVTTNTKAVATDHDSDSTNSEQFPIHGVVNTSIYGGGINDTGRIMMVPTPAATVTSVAVGGGGQHSRLKTESVGGGTGVIRATTVIQQEWREQI
ncbi:integral membrane protein [Rhypophila decipiens]|uniref:Integral membrane protein n=1 Tax=Rhypophila decipiens TaxID=261697 RepID=A0AAN6XYA9_9PEZI|nr:integral membrane protein [Rhypophila decipiens]